MHAVRGTIGFDPNTPDPVAKRASRDRHFAGLSGSEVDAAVEAPADTVGVGYSDVAEENAEALEAWKAGAGFVVEWVAANGTDRQFGRVSGGISADNVVRLIRLLSQRGTTVFTVIKVR